MFNGNISVTHDPYFVVCARTALVNAYRKVTEIKVTSVKRVGGMVVADVLARTEHGRVQHQIQLDSSIYDLACRHVIESIPCAEFRECTAA